MFGVGVKNLIVFIILCYTFSNSYTYMYKDYDMLLTSEIIVIEIKSFCDGQKLLSEICSILTDIIPYSSH